MKLKKTIVAAASISFVFLMALSALAVTTVHHSGLPKVDDIYYKAYPGALPETIVNEFIGGDTDWIGGPSIKDLYDAVIAAGHKVSDKDPMSEFTFFPINCRDYKTTSGEVNFPLNDSTFRIALSYIYGVDDKQTDIYNYYQVDWQYAIDNPVPDAQLPWYNASIHMPNTDFAEAWTRLQAHGYEVDGEDWLSCNGTKLRDLENLYPTGATFYPDGPQGGLVENFNSFITYIGAVGPEMTIAPTDFSTLVTELMSTRNYDIIGIGLTNLGRYVDWIYDLSHSSCAGDWGWNFAGIIDDEFDEWGETILTSMSVDEIMKAASDWQEKFVYELMPWMPVRAGLDFCTTARDERGELMNVIQMDNYGPSNDYSFMCLHWYGEPDVVWPGGAYTRALGDEPHTMNPYTEDTLYGWQFLDRAISGLLAVNPETLQIMPWVATNWTVEHWTSIAELGIVNGSTATFYVRQDVTWQDGYPVTAYDCVANMRAMRVYHPGRYSSTWAHLVYEEADGPYKFNVYFDMTSFYYAEYVAGTSLMVPAHVIEAVEQMVEDGDLASFFDWDPAFSDYADLGLGDPPTEYPFMKQIVGCGPFVFDYYDRSLAVGHVAGYDNFFVNAPVIGSVFGEWRIDPDTTYTYRPMVQNLGAKENSEEGECADMTVDVKIYEDDVLAYTVPDVYLATWDWTYLGPYTTDVLPCGEHTIKVEVYDSEDDSLVHTYIHTLVATVREDVTTYNGERIDFKVDMRDISGAARAFGSYPGHLRWDPPSDINDDFKVDMRDISKVARKFGWECAP